MNKGKEKKEACESEDGDCLQPTIERGLGCVLHMYSLYLYIDSIVNLNLDASLFEYSCGP